MFLCVSLARRVNCKLTCTASKKYQAIKKVSLGATMRNRGVVLGQLDWGLG